MRDRLEKLLALRGPCKSDGPLEALKGSSDKTRDNRTYPRKSFTPGALCRGAFNLTLGEGFPQGRVPSKKENQDD